MGKRERAKIRTEDSFMIMKLFELHNCYTESKLYVMQDSIEKVNNETMLLYFFFNSLIVITYFPALNATLGALDLFGTLFNFSFFLVFRLIPKCSV